MKAYMSVPDDGPAYLDEKGPALDEATKMHAAEWALLEARTILAETEPWPEGAPQDALAALADALWGFVHGGPGDPVCGRCGGPGPAGAAGLCRECYESDGAPIVEGLTCQRCGEVWYGNIHQCDDRPVVLCSNCGDNWSRPGRRLCRLCEPVVAADPTWSRR